MAFDKPYDINPNPGGDTVKTAIVNTDLNVDDIYGNLNILLAQIELMPNNGQELLDLLLPVDGTGSLLDADFLDGFHASDFSQISHSHPEVTSAVPGFMSSIDKQKLDGITSGAEVNVQSDWAETNSSEDSFLRNKPKILEIEGTPQSGNVTVFTGPTSIHGSNEQEMQNLLGYYINTDFIVQTAGSADAGKPIVLDPTGLIHASMIPAVPAQAVWGGITGTLANQTDLQDELDLKFNQAGGMLGGDLELENNLILIGDSASIRTMRLGLTSLAFVNPNRAIYLKLDTDSFKLQGTLTEFTEEGEAILLSGADSAYIQGLNSGGNQSWFLGRIDSGVDVASFGNNVGGQKLSLDENGNIEFEGTAGFTMNGNAIYHEGNPPPGGGGDAVWGSITGTLSDQDDLQAALDAKSDTGHNHDSSYFLESEFINVSAGAGDAGKPILLNSSGQIDSSMLDVSVFHYIGPFTPVAGTEYPDPTGEDFGAFWVVQGVDAGTGYTFTGGDLSGLTVDNGDFMVWSSAGWSIMAGEMNPTLYYKLDGTQALTAPFAGGGQQIKGIANGTSNADAVTVLQLSGKADAGHTHVEADISDLDKYTQAEVDGLVGAKEDGLGNPSTSGYVLSSTDAGVRSWVPPSTGGGGDAVWGSIIGTLSDQDDLQNALDLKLDATAKAADSELLDGLEAVAFELALGNPTIDNQILVSLTDGTRGWSTLPVTQWGGIEGTLASQTDLQSALDGKSPTSHNHDANYLSISGKAADSALLNGKADTEFSQTNHNHDGVYAPVATVSADPPSGGNPGDVWYQI